MKLYELNRGDYFKIGDSEFRFDHVDGAYSVCFDISGYVYHIKAYTEVEKCGDASENKHDKHSR